MIWNQVRFKTTRLHSHRRRMTHLTKTNSVVRTRSAPSAKSIREIRRKRNFASHHQFLSIRLTGDRKISTRSNHRGVVCGPEVDGNVKEPSSRVCWDTLASINKNCCDNGIFLHQKSIGIRICAGQGCRCAHVSRSVQRRDLGQARQRKTMALEDPTRALGVALATVRNCVVLSEVYASLCANRTRRYGSS